MTDSISILLATYNGSKYLKDQLDSLNAQTYKNFKIFARDDMSNDDTLDILKAYNVDIIPSTRNVGVQKNFNILLKYVLNNSNDKYFMFCDQDDIWEKTKIERTLLKMNFLKIKYGNIPLLVHSDLVVVNNIAKILDLSFWNHENIKPDINSFNRLLMQNTITGCTTMINKKLAKLAFPFPSEYISHDAWLGLVASYFGKIGILKETTIKYRQHETNNIGVKSFTTMYFLKKILEQNIFQKKYIQAKLFLDRYRDKLDKETIKMLENFSAIESKSFWQRRKMLLKYKLFKQGFVRNVGLFIKI